MSTTNATGLTIYFGAGGAGLAYCRHSGKLPDIFVDNDPNKWGTYLNEVKITSPEVLISTPLKQIIITSGYIKHITTQILGMGISKDIIHIPPKSFLGSHPFKSKENRYQATDKLYEIMSACNKSLNVVAVGGTALGFCRDNDFILWDFDIDLFAPIQSKILLYDFLKGLGYNPIEEKDSIKGNIVLDNNTQIPFGIDFFDSESSTYIDKYEDYTWEWPTEMFTQYSTVKIHGKILNIPRSHDRYLTGIYGSSWKEANPEFNYLNYSGNVP